MDKIALREKKKYDLLWKENPDYRILSPGEEFFSHFADTFSQEIKEGDLLIDFGCGCARVAKKFLEIGLQVLLVDFSPHCLDAEVAFLLNLFANQLQFQEACLWDLPKDIPVAEWIYCCDVLEHIPESHVDKVLLGMAERTEKGGYLSICLEEDSFGKKVGEPLHLTIKERDWWRKKISSYWRIEKEFVTLDCYYNCCVKKKI
jgi:SAM-dependent methyltransferase